MKMIEELTTKQLRLTEEQRTQIKNIINQYEQQI
jgi:Spy/CpxP family protein refolding chaperone